MITSGSSEDRPYLVQVTAYTASLCEEVFDLDIENDTITHKSDIFFLIVEVKCNLEDSDHKYIYVLLLSVLEIHSLVGQFALVLLEYLYLGSECGS